MLLFTKIFVVIFVIKLKIENSYGQLDLPHHKNGLQNLDDDNEKIPSFLTPTTSVFKSIIDNKGIRRRGKSPRRLRGSEKRNSRFRKTKFLKEINSNALSEKENEKDLLIPFASEVNYDYQPLPSNNLARAHLWSGLNFDSQFHPKFAHNQHLNHKQRNAAPRDYELVNAYYSYPYEDDQEELVNTDNFYYNGIHKKQPIRSVNPNEMDIAFEEDQDEQINNEESLETIGENSNLYPLSVQKRQIDPRINLYRNPMLAGYRNPLRPRFRSSLDPSSSPLSLARNTDYSVRSSIPHYRKERLNAGGHHMSHLERENRYVNPAVMDDYISSIHGHNYENFKPRIYKKSTLSEPSSKEKIIDDKVEEDKMSENANKTETAKIESGEEKKVNQTSIQDLEESLGDTDSNTSVDGDFHLIDLRSINQNGDEEPGVFTYIISPNGRTFIEVDPTFFKNATLPLVGLPVKKTHQFITDNNENNSDVNDQFEEVTVPNSQINLSQEHAIRTPPQSKPFYSYGPPSTLYTKYYTKTDSEGKPQIFLENEMGKKFLLPNENYDRYTPNPSFEQNTLNPGFNVDFSYDVPMSPQYRNADQNEDLTNPIMYILNGVPYRMSSGPTDKERTFALLKKELEIKKAILDKKLGKLQKLTCKPDANHDQYYGYVSDYASPSYGRPYAKREDISSKRSVQRKHTDLEASETTDDHPNVQRRDCNCQHFLPLYSPNLLLGYTRMPQLGAEQSVRDENLRMPFTPILGRPYLGLWRPTNLQQQWSPQTIPGIQANNEHRDRTQRTLRSLNSSPIRIQMEEEKLGPGMRFKKQLTKRSKDEFPENLQEEFDFY